MSSSFWKTVALGLLIATIHLMGVIVAQPASSWASVASSGSGEFICAGAFMQSIYCSYDAGASWFKTVSPSLTWASLAMSSEGDFVVAVPTQGNIYTSTTFGDTWKITSSDTYGTWTSVDCDASGKYVVAASSAAIIAVSTNFGRSWTYYVRFPASTQFHGIASDATGQYVVAVGLNAAYYSNDFGATFNASRSDLSNVLFSAVCSDETGQYALATASNGIYRTQTFGRTWQIAYADNANWGAITLNSAGEVAFAGTENGGLYRSQDGGLSWSLLANLPTESYWIDATIDESSKNVVAAVDGGALYTSDDGGATWTAHLTSCEVGTSYDSVTGDCEYCCLDGTNACTMYNDGSMIQCAACPEFQLSFGDHASCTNPCHYPFVPAYGSNANDVSIPYTCEELNVQATTVAWSVVITVVAGLYLLNLVLVEQHVARYRPLVPLIVIVTTAIPVMEHLSLWLFLLRGTFHHTWVWVGILLCLSLSPVYLLLRMIWHKRRDANIIPQLFVLPGCLASWEVFDHATTTGTFCLQSLLLIPTLIVNSIWLLPMVVILFTLFGTKLHAYGPLYNAWFHRWSGRTDLYEKETLLSVPEFVESRLISLALQSIPAIFLCWYNVHHVQSVDTPHPSMQMNRLALAMAAISVGTLVVRFLLISMRRMVVGSRGLCFDGPLEEDDDGGTTGAGNGHRSTGETLGPMDSKDTFPITYPPRSRSTLPKGWTRRPRWPFSMWSVTYWLDIHYVNDPEADLEAYKRRAKSGRFSLLYSVDQGTGKDLLGRPVPTGKTPEEIQAEEEAEERAAEEEFHVEELRLRAEVDSCIARNRAKWQAFRTEIRRSMAKVEIELTKRIEAQAALAAASSLIHFTEKDDGQQATGRSSTTSRTSMTGGTTTTATAGTTAGAAGAAGGAAGRGGATKSSSVSFASTTK